MNSLTPCNKRGRNPLGAYSYPSCKVMRNIFKQQPKYSEITQGSVITGCVANRYADCPVWGFIITARCDLAQKNKTPIVHYLPIVNFEDFLQKEIIDDLREGWMNELKSNLASRMKEKNLSSSFLDMPLSAEDFEKIIRTNFKKQKEADKFMSDYQRWVGSGNLLIKDIISEKSGEGKLKHEMDRLVNNENSGFYLIEDWKCSNNNSNKYKVILLREIKEMSIDCARCLPDGILEEEKDASYLQSNNLAVTEDRSNFYYVDTEVQSPFVEHILQRFSNNFVRIGVEDLPKAQVSKQLVEQSKLILQ